MANVMKQQAIALLDVAMRTAFGEGLDDEQVEVIKNFDLDFEHRQECTNMLDDMEARMGLHEAHWVRDLLELH